MTWVCALLGCKEITIDLREDHLLQVIGFSDVVLIETKRCLRCQTEREVRSLGRYG